MVKAAADHARVTRLPQAVGTTAAEPFPVANAEASGAHGSRVPVADSARGRSFRDTTRTHLEGTPHLFSIPGREGHSGDRAQERMSRRLLSGCRKQSQKRDLSVGQCLGATRKPVPGGPQPESGQNGGHDGAIRHKKQTA